MKRLRAADTMGGANCPDKKVKWQISVRTFEKWQGQLNSEHEMLSWLRCAKDRGDCSLVDYLWCEVFQKYESRIYSSKNFPKVRTRSMLLAVLVHGSVSW